MKPKVTRGNSFRGVLGYAMNPKKGARLIGGCMAGDDVSSLTREFALVQRLRPDIAKPVLHVSLSLPPGDVLRDGAFAIICEALVKELGLSTHQWCAVRHHDTGHEHVHIVANRIGIDGSVWLGQFEALHAIRICQSLEQRAGLRATPGLKSRSARKRLSKQELERAMRTTEPPPRLVLRCLVDATLRSAPLSLTRFVQTLESLGAEAKVVLGGEDQVLGLALGWGQCRIKASRLGPDYAWKQLVRRGIVTSAGDSDYLLAHPHALERTPGDRERTRASLPIATADNLKDQASALELELKAWAEQGIEATSENERLDQDRLSPASMLSPSEPPSPR